MDSFSVASAQTTQSTNTSDSSYPILFQFQPSSISETKDVATNSTLDSPYAKQKSTVQVQLIKRVRIALALVGILSIVMVIFVLSFYLPTPEKQTNGYYNRDKVTIDSLQVDLKVLEIFVNNYFAKTSLRIQTNLSSSKTSPFVVKQTNISASMKKGNTFLNISLLSDEDTVKCWNLLYSSSDEDSIENCLHFDNGTWFGVGEREYQTWQVNDANISMVPFVTFDLLQGSENKSYGGVLEPYVVGSTGFAMLVDRRHPLYMSINSPNVGKLCFKLAPQSKRANPGAQRPLSVKICMAKNVLDVHRYMVRKFFKRTGAVPDTKMLISPVWSTWAKYKANITQEKVLKFAKEIKNNSMPISQLEIDDKYSTHYGDLDFDPVKFKDPRRMIQELHSMGMRVTIWVYPFANFDSKAFKEGLKYWVQVNGVPGMVVWWNGFGAILDVTNDKGADWFKKRLKDFKDAVGLDGFKFDAGEVRYLPTHHMLNKSLENVNFFSTKYVQLAESFGGISEVRVGYGNQDSRLFTRLLDRSSTWGIDNGLKSVLTATLTLGILGYPFILPDMVGGNAYKGLPDKELYVRWAQLNAFLPSIQFSLAPWDYDNETTVLVKAALHIRDSIAGDLLNFSKIAATDNHPIIRPLWWLAPEDRNALVNDSEFLVGDRYLVAPVLEKGAQDLVVYLVKGKWQEQFGSRTIYNVSENGYTMGYKVDLSDVIYFKRLD